MIELELTYLAKSLPDNLVRCESKEMVDLYIENGTDHADLRVRKSGDVYELTRKTPVAEGDASAQQETTIALNEAEFESLSGVHARRIEKTRYYVAHEGRTAEFDVFKGELAGLVVIDFEFATEAEKAAFVRPDFCLADITQERFIAGGVLAGKSYADIESELDRFSYQSLSLT